MESLDSIYRFARFPKNPEDFWQLNFELCYLDPFTEFKDVKGSAKIMCAIWLAYDPKSSFTNGNIPEALAKSQVDKNFLKDPDFNWGDYSKYVRAFKDYCRTPIEKSLDDFKRILDERQRTAEDLDWDTDFEKKDKIILTQKDYYEKYFEMRDRMNNEREEALAHGNYTPSELEARGQNI